VIPPIAIQCVPERKDLVDRLLIRLPEADAFEDENHRGPLWQMERIMNAHAETGVLILQDDVAVAPWFLEELEKAIWPDRQMMFFNAYSKFLRPLYDQGYCYATTRNCWGQANYYPAEMIAAYQEWAAQQDPIGPPRVNSSKLRQPWRSWSSDDPAIGKFCRDTRRDILMTLPHLVNHAQVKSVLGHPRTVGGKARISGLFGKDLLRPWDKTKVGRLPR